MVRVVGTRTGFPRTINSGTLVTTEPPAAGLELPNHIVRMLTLRFSLRSLLIMFVIIAAALWWGTWPGRTFNTFKAALKNENFERANAMVQVGDWTLPNGDTLPCQFNASDGGVELKCGGALHRVANASRFVGGLVAQEPSFMDLVSARRVYVDSGYADSVRRFEFVVKRGTIKLHFR